MQRSLEYAHVHRGVELGAVLSGTGIVYLEDRRYPIEPGDVYFVDGMMDHETAGDAVSFIIMITSSESLVDIHGDTRGLLLLQPFTALRSGVSPVLKNRRDLVAQLEDVLSLSQTGSPHDRLAAWIRTGLVLVEIARSVSAHLTRTYDPAWMKDNELVTRAVQYINLNFGKQFSLADMARALNVSGSRLSHLFKEYTRISPMEYRTQVRMAHAVYRVKSTDDKLTGIAADCGIANMSLFHRLFRRYHGGTPAAMRRRRRTP
ncbi:MAG: helix-turn-helix domain-containing protein [Chitinivibrionales bacterium]|nr:helix-turn-helix domain-containing protein [Chitinivibrionales bacterium]MBD3396450.1 helix-turn-helix domain-containing protein [Chitinivibrionales bacterium]